VCQTRDAPPKAELKATAAASRLLVADHELTLPLLIPNHTRTAYGGIITNVSITRFNSRLLS
jgi:hypothetical protein